MGSRDALPQQPEGEPRYWCRDNFVLTTDKSCLDPQCVNDAFNSDLMWWNQPLELSEMKKMLANCMTVAIFWVPETADEMKKTGIPRRKCGPNFKMVGLSRVVTDYVTFAYLTDVFVLEEYQRRGLARWMMQGIKDIVDGWPTLRGLMLMTHDKKAAAMYEKELGAVDFNKGPSAGLVVLEMPGKAEVPIPECHR